MARRATQGQSRLPFGMAQAEEDPATGEEAPPGRPGEPDALSVSAFVARLKGAVEKVPGLQGVWVRGEVSNFSAPASGHWYFTLKDEDAQVRCVMWRSRVTRVPFDPEDGMEVLVLGSAGVYEASGSLQLYAEEMRPGGEGALALALRQLRRKLAAAGLFDDDRKRDLPRFPARVGVVTSGTGAVWHDIQRVARRRFRGIHLLLCPVKVQGPGAAEEIAAGIERFNRHRAADVLIVGRGGGSLEDLWAFNEEVVVRAVAASRIPVVSAVGHETDWTLCDQAADARAPTPSAAAELVVPDAAEFLAYLAIAEGRLGQALQARARRLRERFERAEASPVWAAERLLREPAQRLDEAERALARAAERQLERKAALLSERVAVLHSLSPLGVLARGYAVAQREDGAVVRAAEDVAPGDGLSVRVRNGTIAAKVTEVSKDDGDGDDVRA